MVFTSLLTYIQNNRIMVMSICQQILIKKYQQRRFLTVAVLQEGI